MTEQRIECEIRQRERPAPEPGKVFRFSEVFITTPDGARHYSRLWHDVPDTPFSRADQIEAFKRRRKAVAKGASTST